MITRKAFPRLWTAAPTTGLPAKAMGPMGRWSRGAVLTGGVQPLILPEGGSGFGYAMDPSDPRTWRQPVRWT